MRSLRRRSCPGNCQGSSWRTIPALKWTRWAARQEFTRPATPVRSQAMRKTLRSCWANPLGSRRRAISAARVFVVCWRWRSGAGYSALFAEWSREKSPISRAAPAGLATIPFSCLREAIKRSRSFPRQEKIGSATGLERWKNCAPSCCLERCESCERDSRQPSGFGRRGGPGRRAGRLCRTACCSPDLIAHLVNSRRANFVQHGDYIAVHGHGRSADGDFDARVCLVQLVKTREHLVVGHKNVVKINRVTFHHLDGNIILHLTGRRRDGGGKIDPDSFHVGLAKAHHHEAGQKEEHDVDQWNDLNSRSFMWNR